MALCRGLLLAPVSDLLPKPPQDYRDLYEALTEFTARLLHLAARSILSLPPARYSDSALEAAVQGFS